MAATPTRTLNPLPFQDLEPHRFEDLVRQLAYGFRPWTSLEAVGRGGSDEGIDIRGVELGPAIDLDETEEDSGEDESKLRSSGAERLWIIQCKREKNLGPAAVHRVVAESLRSLQTPPFGFILAVASDVSKKSRDVFREEMVARGIEQFAIWARGELEDRLFQPENDPLLFAYFNLSLRARRRSATTTIRSEIAIKRQLQKLLDDQSSDTFVLVRDPADERYPLKPISNEPAPCWYLCRLQGLRAPSRATFVVHERLAAIADDHKGWDVIEECDVLPNQALARLRGLNAWDVSEHEDHEDDPNAIFWRDYIDEAQRAHLVEYRHIHLRRILAIDLKGDGFYPIPHIIVASLPDGSLFEPGGGSFIDPLSRYSSSLAADADTRVPLFPRPIPSPNDIPPRNFDQTLPQCSPLPDQVSAHLEAKLPDAMENQGVRAERTLEKAESSRFEAFKIWRDDVGLPVFSAFVHALRARGQRARVVATGDRRWRARGDGEVTLKFQVRRSSPHNPLYWVNGHVQVRCMDYGRWVIDLSPQPDEGRTYQSNHISVPEIGPSKEALEGWVTVVIDELTTNRH